MITNYCFWNCWNFTYHNSQLSTLNSQLSTLDSQLEQFSTYLLYSSGVYTLSKYFTFESLPECRVNAKLKPSCL